MKIRSRVCDVSRGVSANVKRKRMRRGLCVFDYTCSAYAAPFRNWSTFEIACARIAKKTKIATRIPSCHSPAPRYATEKMHSVYRRAIDEQVVHFFFLSRASADTDPFHLSVEMQKARGNSSVEPVRPIDGGACAHLLIFSSTSSMTFSCVP